MSRTTKGSAAVASSGYSAQSVKPKSAATACAAFGPMKTGRASALRPRRANKPSRRSEQTGNDIEERQGHQHSEHRHADALPDLECAVGDGAAFDDLRK